MHQANLISGFKSIISIFKINSNLKLQTKTLNSRFIAKCWQLPTKTHKHKHTYVRKNIWTGRHKHRAIFRLSKNSGLNLNSSIGWHSLEIVICSFRLHNQTCNRLLFKTKKAPISHHWHLKPGFLNFWLEQWHKARLT